MPSGQQNTLLEGMLKLYDAQLKRCSLALKKAYTSPVVIENLLQAKKQLVGLQQQIRSLVAFDSKTPNQLDQALLKEIKQQAKRNRRELAGLNGHIEVTQCRDHYAKAQEYFNDRYRMAALYTQDNDEEHRVFQYDLYKQLRSAAQGMQAAAAALSKVAMRHKEVLGLEQEVTEAQKQTAAAFTSIRKKRIEEYDEQRDYDHNGRAKEDQAARHLLTSFAPELANTIRILKKKISDTNNSARKRYLADAIKALQPIQEQIKDYQRTSSTSNYMTANDCEDIIDDIEFALKRTLLDPIAKDAKKHTIAQRGFAKFVDNVTQVFRQLFATVFNKGLFNTYETARILKGKMKKTFIDTTVKEKLRMTRYSVAGLQAKAYQFYTWVKAGHMTPSQYQEAMQGITDIYHLQERQERTRSHEQLAKHQRETTAHDQARDKLIDEQTEHFDPEVLARGQALVMFALSRGKTSDTRDLEKAFPEGEKPANIIKHGPAPTVDKSSQTRLDR